MEMAFKNFPMEISIKVNMKKANLQALVNITGKMEVISKANSS